jgi:5-methylcytosine-specific restriction enzyme subunit McrC
MSKQQLLQVLEYEKLFVKGRKNGLLTQAQFEALVRYNQEHDNRFFRIIHKGIKFKQYVGVIQVGNLTIEILPKADRRPSDQMAKKQWHTILFDMLKVCRFIKTEGSSEADLLIRNRSLLDIYLLQFLVQVEKLMHQGLSKQYYYVSGNRKAMVGQLKFQDHLTQNLIHKERFFVRHQTYAFDHLLHQILAQALLLIPKVTTSTDILERAKRLEARFPELTLRKISAALFQKIRYNRKTAAYRPAIELARLLLLNYSPDVRSGKQHIMAILFDMNMLFEEYIYRMLKHAETIDIKVSRQQGKRFWEYKLVKPDIIIRKGEQTIIVDTKWKILDIANPSDADLKQMYVYHHYFNAEHTILLYPDATDLSERSGTFHLPKESAYRCHLQFVSLVDQQQQLNRRIGLQLIQNIEELSKLGSDVQSEK